MAQSYFTRSASSMCPKPSTTSLHIRPSSVWVAGCITFRANTMYSRRRELSSLVDSRLALNVFLYRVSTLRSALELKSVFEQIQAAEKAGNLSPEEKKKLEDSAAEKGLKALFKVYLTLLIFWQTSLTNYLGCQTGNRISPARNLRHRSGPRSITILRCPNNCQYASGRHATARRGVLIRQEGFNCTGRRGWPGGERVRSG